MGRHRIFRFALVGLAGWAAVAAPLAAAEQAGAWRLLPTSDQSTMLDCFEAAGRTLISAHRGGPTPGLPENAIPRLEEALAWAKERTVLQIDFKRSADDAKATAAIRAAGMAHLHKALFW